MERCHVVRVYVTNFEAAESEIRFVRDAVFGDEQGVPREVDWDGTDAGCIHAVVRDADGHPVGTGRLQPDGRIGRLAVLALHRGRGIGTRLLEALLDEADRRGTGEDVYLHAQCSAVRFYQRHGFVRCGSVFKEAGILHVEMRRRGVSPVVVDEKTPPSG